MSLVRKSLAAAGACAVTLLAVGTATPASAATAGPAGAFADAKALIVDLTLLTAIPVPGQLAGTPLDPNGFSHASQSCPPQATSPATDQFPGNVDASPLATANTLNTMAGTDCTKPSAVASAETEKVTALVNAGAPVVTADIIRAQANSDCVKAPNADGTQFVNLTVNGNPIGGTPSPNTVIEIPGVAKVILNEQHPTADGRGIVVNGVHIIGESPVARGDIVISHAVSGVSCPNGAGSTANKATTDITFTKDASPKSANPGDTVTYTAHVTNNSKQACDVISFTDHLAPGFTYQSTKGTFGTTPVDPINKRTDGGQDVTFRPDSTNAVTIAAGQTATQDITVKLASNVKPGTYFNTLEIFCNANGNFASGPIAPVTVPAPAAAPAVQTNLAGPTAEPAQLPRTGGAPMVAALSLLLLVGAAGVRRLTTR